MTSLSVRPYEPADLPWAEGLIDAEFGGRLQARLGSLVDALAGPGLVAERDGHRTGILTSRREGPDLEIVYLQVVVPHQGAGTALVEAVAEQAGAERLWLVTTNDNLDALRFYQRRAFTIAAIRPGAANRARLDLKPTIPEIGNFGIPVRDEIILERVGPR